MSWLKRKLPKKRWKRVIIYIASVLLILLAVDMVLVQLWRRIDISPETTRITSPLNARGTPDYLAALNAMASEGVTAENNAAPELLKIFGTEDLPADYRAKALPPLDLPAAGTPALFTPFEVWDRKHPPATQTAEPAESGQIQPFNTVWSAADHPRWHAWLTEQRAAVEQARQAVQGPRFYVPYVLMEDGVTLADLHLSSLNKTRNLGSLLMSDAMRCVGEGDVAGFQSDVTATLRLSRLVGQGQTLIEYLVYMGIERLGTEGIKNAATRPAFLSGQQARDLLQMLETLPPAPSADRTIENGERWFMLDTTCAMAQTGRLVGQESESKSSRVVRLFLPIHYNSVLRDANAHYDRLVAAMRVPTFPQRQAATRALREQLDRQAAGPVVLKLAQPTKMISIMQMASMMPSLERIGEHQEWQRMEMGLARVALALRIHHAEQREFPETLAALVPGILKELPADGFVEKPLIYRREGKGYVLYSVGPNLVDDGGAKRGEKPKGAFDLVVRGE
jgi:hypothetical protein